MRHFQEDGLANTASAEKRIRQAEKRYEHNRAQRSRMRTGIKKVLGAPDADESGVEAEAARAPHRDARLTRPPC